MAYIVYLTLEPYLAQYLIHENGGEQPVHIKRGSAESDLLEKFLKPQPKDPGYVPQTKPMEGQVGIVVPCFKSKNYRVHNYLSPRAAVCLHACIRNRFCVQLWKDLHTVGNVVKRTDITIQEWMKEHGIENDDRNWNTIAKILQRKRALYCKDGRLKNRKSAKKCENKGEIMTTSDAICPPDNL